jgi:hypothetical protein
VFRLNRFVPVSGVRRRPRPPGGHWSARQGRQLTHLKRIGAMLLVLISVGAASVAGWMQAGGTLPFAESLFDQLALGTPEGSAGSAHVQIGSMAPAAPLAAVHPRSGAIVQRSTSLTGATTCRTRPGVTGARPTVRPRRWHGYLAHMANRSAASMRPSH